MTAKHREPFDFSQAMRLLCEDICRRVPDFHHIRMDEVAVTFAQARRRQLHGLQAKLTPLRFLNGDLTEVRGGQRWTVQRLFDDRGREMLYILTFYLPRFLNQPFREKLVTVFHELYHISPAFDGDIRRLGGRYHVHSHSQGEYDRQMGRLADLYLRQRPAVEGFAFLKKRFSALQRDHGQVLGIRVPIPKLIPLADSRSA